MGKLTQQMIKKAISETIIEELFRDLGFFVLKLGQENTVNPLTQLQSFITSCGGKFKLNYNDAPITFVRRLPDFVIIDKNGVVQFLEVKFRANGYLSPDQRESCLLYPNYILVVNNFVDEEFFKTHSKRDIFNEPMPQELKMSRFHVWTPIETESEKMNEETHTLAIETLEMWLKEKYDLDAKEPIEKYEQYVAEWLSQKKPKK
ncbi:hypothetical protein KY348_05725 [Candidatus Woesearchaeota archaeon]|nr:hypothetical protein [Candidatus Woesearchaeota archaeon]